jgi:hypothetical protein
MHITFYMKGGAKFSWLIPEALEGKFSLPACIKAMRADGHFIAEELYVLASEVIAIRLNEGA